MSTSASAYLYPWGTITPQHNFLSDLGFAAQTTENWDVHLYEKHLDSGLHVKILQTGLFMFDFSSCVVEGAKSKQTDDVEILERILSERLYVFNAHLLFCYSGLKKLNNLDRQKHYVQRNHLLNISDINTPNLFQTINRDYKHLDLKINNTRLCTSTLVASDQCALAKGLYPLAVFEESFISLDKLLRLNDPEALQLADLLASSLYELDNHRYHTALIHAWAVIEKRLKYLYKDHCHLHNAKINPKIKISNVIKILYSAGQICESMNHVLSEVKDIRNDWIHELKTINYQDSTLCIKIAVELFNQGYGTNLHIDPCLGWY